jgi:hypothetical protein
MTKSSVDSLLRVIFNKLIVEKDIENYNDLKESLFELFAIVPVKDAEVISMEKNMFNIDSTARIESNFSEDTVNVLLTDFDRILIAVSSSLLPE